MSGKDSCEVSSRPLSPHMTIYRPQITSVLSILHRITGVALAVGAVFVVWWFWALAAGPEHFNCVQRFWGSLFGTLMLIGWSWALFYHLCAGIRHLMWDDGKGLDLETVEKSGWLVVISSFALTALAWGSVVCGVWS